APRTWNPAPALYYRLASVGNGTDPYNELQRKHTGAPRRRGVGSTASGRHHKRCPSTLRHEFLHRTSESVFGLAIFGRDWISGLGITSSRRARQRPRSIFRFGYSAYPPPARPTVMALDR